MTNKDKNYLTVHSWMKYRYGRPQVCEGENCRGNSKVYDWAKKKGYEYIKDRNAFMRLCRSCHRIYDQTEELTKKRVKNLIPYTKENHPQSIAILQFTLAGDLIREFKSVPDARRCLGKPYASIWQALSGLYKSAAGYKWKYKHDFINSSKG